jgi:late competence protein required for DNA uptake (superfamily II DNA/RNA helicase)
MGLKAIADAAKMQKENLLVEKIVRFINEKAKEGMYEIDLSYYDGITMTEDVQEKLKKHFEPDEIQIISNQRIRW